MLFVISWFYLVPVIASGPGVIEMMNRFYGEMDSHWYELIFQVRNFGKGLDNVSKLATLYFAAVKVVYVSEL